MKLICVCAFYQLPQITTNVQPVPASIIHADILEKGKLWSMSQMICVLGEEILFQKQNVIKHPCTKKNSNKTAYLSLFKTNWARIAILDAKKRQTAFMNAIKINYFNRYINKRFKVKFSPWTARWPSFCTETEQYSWDS